MHFTALARCRRLESEHTKMNQNQLSPKTGTKHGPFIHLNSPCFGFQRFIVVVSSMVYKHSKPEI